MYRIRNEYQKGGTLSVSDKSLLDKILKGGLRSIPEKDRARAKSLYSDYNAKSKKQGLPQTHYAFQGVRDPNKPIMSDTSLTPKEWIPTSLEGMDESNYDPYAPDVKESSPGRINTSTSGHKKENLALSNGPLRSQAPNAATAEAMESWANSKPISKALLDRPKIVSKAPVDTRQTTSADIAKWLAITGLQTLQVPAAAVGEAINFAKGEDASILNIIPRMGAQTLVGDALDIENDYLRGAVNFIADPTNYSPKGFLSLGAKAGRRLLYTRPAIETIQLRKGVPNIPTIPEKNIYLPYYTPTADFNHRRFGAAAIADKLENELEGALEGDDVDKKQNGGTLLKYLSYQKGGEIDNIIRNFRQASRSDNRHFRNSTNTLNQIEYKRPSRNLKLRLGGNIFNH